MALDIIRFIFINIFVLSTGRADYRGTDCPSNTVEIVFTKNGVICVTTSSIPELNHLAIDPKHIPNLLSEPPIVQKISLPVMTQPFVSAPPVPSQQIILPQMPVPNIGIEVALLEQPLSPQPMLTQPLAQPLVQPSMTEFMARRLPLSHDNTINQNFDYVDRSPDLIQDKRIYYQKMLWDKLRRGALIKSLLKDNQNHLFGVHYVEDNTDINQNTPNQSSEEKLQNLQQNIENPTKEEKSNSEPQIDNKKTSEEQQVSDVHTSGQSTNNNQNNNDYNDYNQNQEPFGLEENSNEKEQILKDYLKYLNKDEDSPSSHNTKSEPMRVSRQYSAETAQTNSKVPDIITGYIPEDPIGTNAHTFGAKIRKNHEHHEDEQMEPMVSPSQLNYEYDRPESHLKSHGLVSTMHFPQNEDQSLTLVSTGMTFGHRLGFKNNEPKIIGFGYKSYPQYNEEKANKYRPKKSQFIIQSLNDERTAIEDDIPLVTANPSQREIIESFESKQYNTRRNQRKFSAESIPKMGFNENNAIDYQMNKDFHLDERRIEYNGWRPLRLNKESNEQSLDESSPEELNENMKTSSSSQIVTAILPITGRVSNKWKAII